MSNHTPGPWRVGNAGNAVFGPPNGNPSPETIATVKKWENASLIAAAPELFAIVLDEASLYAGMDADEFTPSTAAHIKAMRSIIAKVTGEPNQ